MKRNSELKKIFLILFDISGYTKFMQAHKDRIVHAEQIVGELLSTVIDTATEPFIFYEFSGDAVSFYVESDESPAMARDIWEQVDGIFAAFRRRECELFDDNVDRPCKECKDCPRLKLKAILHHCDVVITTLHGLRKIAGPDVILAHKLLKNSVQAREYVIVTTEFYFVGGMMTPMGALLQGEQYEGFGDIGVLVWYPEGGMPDEVRPPSRAVPDRDESESDDQKSRIGWD
jgi:hypothetical protein